jgi:hypothetical protein
MTDGERQLLKDTAENRLRLLKKWDDTIDGMAVAISELYRAGITTPERKLTTVARLKIHRDLMLKDGKGVKYLSDLIDELDKWAGYEARDSHHEP